jgi:hypothetical protein
VVSPLHPDTSDNGKKIFAEWQELKSTPIPIQTPPSDRERELEKGIEEMMSKISDLIDYTDAIPREISENLYKKAKQLLNL